MQKYKYKTKVRTPLSPLMSEAFDQWLYEDGWTSQTIGMYRKVGKSFSLNGKRHTWNEHLDTAFVRFLRAYLDGGYRFLLSAVIARRVRLRLVLPHVQK